MFPMLTETKTKRILGLGELLHFSITTFLYNLPIYCLKFSLGSTRNTVHSLQEVLILVYILYSVPIYCLKFNLGSTSNSVHSLQEVPILEGYQHFPK